MVNAFRNCLAPFLVMVCLKRINKTTQTTVSIPTVIILDFDNSV